MQPEPVYDKIANEYDTIHHDVVNVAGFSSEHIHEYKAKETYRRFMKVNRNKKNGAGEVKNILDFGCGIGNVDPYLRKYFPDASICGVDLSPESIKIAKDKNRVHNVAYATFDITKEDKLPFDVKFDLVFIASVFHCSPQELHQDFLSLLFGSMNDGALLIIFEHNPINPVTRAIVRQWMKRTKEEIVLLSPGRLKKMAGASGFSIEKRCYTMFVPNFLSFLKPLEKCIAWIPLGAQYYIAARKPDTDDSRSLDTNS